MNQFESAKSLISKGFHVFPVGRNSKLPAIEDFPNVATRDIHKIEEWFGNGKKRNIGISTSHYADSEYLIVVDVDNKGEKKGSEELLKLELEGFDLPDTFEQQTPTGGRHLVYRSKIAVKQGTNVLGPGLDIRAKGGYIVGAGSALANGVYTAIQREIAEAPKWLVEKLGKAKEKTTNPDKFSGLINEESAIKRGSLYLLTNAKVSLEGQGGNETAYKTICHLKDLGVNVTDVLALLLEHWNERCSPPWTEEELEKIIQNAYHYGTEPRGIAAPEVEFTPVKEEEPKKSFLEKINEKFALIFGDGGHVILEETIDEKGRPKRLLMPEISFKRYFSTDTIQEAKGKPRSQAEHWLDWKGRRSYRGLCFAPEREPRNNYLNLWRGFAVKPLPFDKANSCQQKGVTMLLEHILENVCNGHKENFNWVMGYFAHLIQKPYERPLTTLVLKGSKGTGKNAPIDRIGKLLGTHYLVAHDSRYLTSNFNGHFDSCLMLVLDEAFWSGDKTAEGKLKGLTTAPEILIEKKGREPYMVDNLVRIIVIGNEDWLVPASADERRYAVFEMSEKRKQDLEFFNTMRVLLDEEGGNRVLLSYLQNFDLSSVNVNIAPSTEALLDQKLGTLDPLGQWWEECLQSGTIRNSDFQDGWPEKMSKDNFRAAIDWYYKARNIKGRTLSSPSIGKRLKKYLPSLEDHKGRQQGDYKKFVREYIFPTLEKARKEWEAYIGHEVNWNE